MLMPTTHESESGFTLGLAPDPMGPMTLPHHISITDTAVRAHERMRYGNAFIPSGTIEKTRRSQDDLHARMELLLETHPELAGMYAQHEQLLHKHYATEKAGGDVTETQQKCRELAEQIVALEQSVDLGEVD